MLRALDGYSYYHKLAQTHALLSTQLTVQATNRSLLRVWDVVLSLFRCKSFCQVLLTYNNKR